MPCIEQPNKKTQGPKYPADGCQGDIKVGSNGKYYISESKNGKPYRWHVLNEKNANKVIIYKIMKEVTDISNTPILEDIYDIIDDAVAVIADENLTIGNYLDVYPSLWDHYDMKDTSR